MPTATKLTLSGSVDGRGIKLITTNQFDVTTLHTGPTDPAVYDEVWIYCVSIKSDFEAIILFGGQTNPDDYIESFVRGENAPIGQGLHEVVSGLILKGNATPLVVRALNQLDAGADPLIFFGYVNRISP